MDRGHHVKIKEVIHPFTPTDGDGERIVHTDCGFGLRAGEERARERGWGEVGRRARARGAKS